MSNWDMPSEEQMDQIESTIPKLIPDFPAGHFKGMIEQIEQVLDSDGKERNDVIRLVLRIAECGDAQYVGQLMYYTIYMKDKQGRFIPRSYRFLTALDPDLKKGGSWHPNNLLMIEFEAVIEYSGKYWNITEPVFIQKHKDFGFD